MIRTIIFVCISLFWASVIFYLILENDPWGYFIFVIGFFILTFFGLAYIRPKSAPTVNEVEK